MFVISSQAEWCQVDPLLCCSNIWHFVYRDIPAKSNRMQLLLFVHCWWNMNIWNTIFISVQRDVFLCHSATGFCDSVDDVDHFSELPLKTSIWFHAECSHFNAKYMFNRHKISLYNALSSTAWYRYQWEQNPVLRAFKQCFPCKYNLVKTADISETQFVWCLFMMNSIY